MIDRRMTRFPRYKHPAAGWDMHRLHWQATRYPQAVSDLKIRLAIMAIDREYRQWKNDS